MLQFKTQEFSGEREDLTRAVCDFCGEKSEWYRESYPETMGGWKVIFTVESATTLAHYTHQCAACAKLNTVNRFTPEAAAILKAVAKTLPEQPTNVQEV
jgi:hypothetical protein